MDIYVCGFSLNNICCFYYLNKQIPFTSLLRLSNYILPDISEFFASTRLSNIFLVIKGAIYKT